MITKQHVKNVLDQYEKNRADGDFCPDHGDECIHAEGFSRNFEQFTNFALAIGHDAMKNTMEKVESGDIVGKKAITEDFVRHVMYVGIHLGYSLRLEEESQRVGFMEPANTASLGAGQAIPLPAGDCGWTPAVPPEGSKFGPNRTIFAHTAEMTIEDNPNGGEPLFSLKLDGEIFPPERVPLSQLNPLAPYESVEEAIQMYKQEYPHEDVRVLDLRKSATN